MVEQKLMIAGPAGRLESLWAQPPAWQENNPVAVCCHPHPLHGGSMQNKVVHTLAKTFSEMGSAVLRFNFRGVGKSEGEFAHGEGEQADLLAVVNWLRQHYPSAPLWLGGFSFGAFVVAMVHAQIQPQPQRLILVAPAVDIYPQMQAITIGIRDWILVQGGQDDIVSPTAVSAWLKGQAHKPRLIWLDDAGHFFHGQLTRLQQRILSNWKPAT